MYLKKYNNIKHIGWIYHIRIIGYLGMIQDMRYNINYKILDKKYIKC